MKQMHSVKGDKNYKKCTNELCKRQHRKDRRGCSKCI